MTKLTNEAELVATAAILAGDQSVWGPQERALLRTDLATISESTVSAFRKAIADGADPLGEAFCRIRSPKTRRAVGATYTPMDIVAAMVSWAAHEHVQPARVVEPGAGSGRFLAAAAECFPLSELIAVETDPLAALLVRANANVRGFADRLVVELTDYRSVRLPQIKGVTLFIGNPPYVRHHGIDEHWKEWFATTALRYGVKASKLAGLHIHFFLKTLALAREGDFGTFITSAEWLDVNYGLALRKLLADGLGGTSLHVLDPAASAFPDAATTAAITCFRIGQRPDHLRVRAVGKKESLNGLDKGRAVPWSEVEKAPRWSIVVRPRQKPPTGYMDLGELFRVHRGQVTGANGIWIAGPHAKDLPDEYLIPTVTKARELFEAGLILDNSDSLKLVIDIPPALDMVRPRDRPIIDHFLAWAKSLHADSGYIARTRRAWWSVGLKKPAPIVCTYMARRPPAFVRNVCGARLLNIAHGLYPREPLPEETIMALVAWLRDNVRLDAGRVYAGGLTKFEPREVERVPIPRPESLETRI